MLPFTEHWGLYVLGVPKHGFAVWEAIRGGKRLFMYLFFFLYEHQQHQQHRIKVNRGREMIPPERHQQEATHK
jgi:hypothetical protein